MYMVTFPLAQSPAIPSTKTALNPHDYGHYAKPHASVDKKESILNVLQ